MNDAAANAPLFIDAFYSACTTLSVRHPDFAIPDAAMINTILAKHNEGYDIQPPDLIAQNPNVINAVPEHVPSLDAPAQEVVKQSLKQSDEYLSRGQYRQAVQEILWLLETISTLFQGLSVGEGTVEG